MVNEKVCNISKVWFRFSKTIKNDKTLPFRWEQLPEHRFEEFIDFKMDYFVKHEMVRVAVGIPKNVEAMSEYRQVMSKLYKEPSYHTDICCVDDESNTIVAINSLKLYKSGEPYVKVMPVRTTEMNTFYKVLDKRNNACPVSEVLVKYGVNTIFDDGGLAVHPDFRGFRLTIETALLRRTVCKAFGVTLTGAWMTSAAVQKTSENEGWETVYEVSPENLEKMTGVKFPTRPAMIVYKVKRVE